MLQVLRKLVLHFTMASYASILLFSEMEFGAKLNDGQFVDLQGFCKAVSIPVCSR